MNQIKFVDLGRQFKAYENEIRAEIESVLQSTSFIMGPKVQELEERLAEYVGVRYAIGCGSGTDALILALLALELDAGAEVITTPFSFFATAEAIAFLGYKPVFVDIREDTYNINAQKIEEKITDKTGAIIAVSLFGQPADFDEINRVATKYGIPVIEDGAQSFGARYKGRMSCGLTDIGVTSFFPAKPLGCYGDGGMVFTNDEKIAERVKSLRVHGQIRRYTHKYIGFNGRLDSIQAAVVLAKFKHFEVEISRRNYIARQYDKALSHYVKVPMILEHNRSVYAQYSIRVREREALINFLKEKGIPTAVHYPTPIHLQEAMKFLGYKAGDFPVAEQVSKEIMSLPMHPFLSDDEINYITAAVIEFFESRKR